MSHVPSSWATVPLLSVSKLLRGVTYTKDVASSLPKPGHLPVLRANNLQGRKFDLSDLVYVPSVSVSEQQLIRSGDVVFATSSGSISVVGKAVQSQSDMDAGFGAFCGVLRPATALDSRYFGHFFSTEAYRTLVSAMARGSNINNLKREHFESLSLPVAPRLEQQRIADKLDTVLSRVDACRDRLARVTPLLKRFRRSVFAAATSGRLTLDWREEDRPLSEAARSLTPVELPTGYSRLSKQAFKPTRIPVDVSRIPVTWLVPTVGDLYKAGVLVDFADGNHGGLYPRKEDFRGEGALFLTATQMDETWNVELGNCPRLGRHKAKTLTKGWAKHGDVLLSHNATVGRVGMLDSEDEDVLLGTSVTFYRFNADHFSAKFARVLFSSSFFQDQLRSVMEQTTRDQVPITKQVSLSLLMPPLPEQIEIVRRVEAVLAFADRLEARLVQVQGDVDRLTPSLLAKAFRGELVPQDPADEPAAELLKRLAAQREAAPAQPRRQRAAA